LKFKIFSATTLERKVIWVAKETQEFTVPGSESYTTAVL